MTSDIPSAPVSEPPPDQTAQPEQPEQPGAEQPWAARFGLVRPRHGRYVAGVCAAIGRATNTDPLLWRVIIGVLAFFGVGIVFYLAAWVLTPAEGDTASPVEALFNRGYSSTSSVLTLALAVIAVVLLGAMTDSFLVSVIGAVGIVVVALAANPGQRGRPAEPARVPDPAPTTVLPPVGTTAYQPPFAPYGPYASAVPPVPPLPLQPLKLKREPSRLGRLIFGLTLVALGVLGVIDLANFASVPSSDYIAVALGVVGLGLIIGAWLGRARGFVFIGILLCLALPIAADENANERSHGPGSVSWSPNSITEISDSYEHRFGEARLDLTNVDFAGQTKEITVDISFGDLQIIVPDNVDVVVESDVNLGDADIFGINTSGPGVQHTERNNGPDGEGGGLLRLHLEVKFAHAEVTR